MHLTKKTLVVVALFSLVLAGVASGQGSIHQRLHNFVALVYESYATEAFGEVYEVMHPSIQGTLSKDEYVTFQEHHFERLRLEISEIEVGKVSTNPRIPSPLRTLLPLDLKHELYGVDLSYRAHFVSGIRLNQSISKTVYVAVANPGTTEESMYLLWDPSSIEEEEQEQ